MTLATVLSAAACAAVPDVVFVADDASIDAVSDAASDGPRDGGGGPDGCPDLPDKTYCCPNGVACGGPGNCPAACDKCSSCNKATDLCCVHQQGNPTCVTQGHPCN